MTLLRFQPSPFSMIYPASRNTVSTPPAFSRPAVNIKETAEGFEIEMAAPGLNREDFEVKVEKNTLTIAARKTGQPSENGVQVHRSEFSLEAFERSFSLPDSIDPDKVKAAYTNGILRVQLMFKPEVKPVVRSVEVA